MWLLVGLLVLVQFEPVCLAVDVVFCPFLVHLEDMLLPFRVGAGDAESNVGNGLHVGVGNALSDGFHEHPSFCLVIPLLCQLGLLLKLSEKEVSGAVILISPIFCSWTSSIAGSQNCCQIIPINSFQSRNQYQGPC